MKLHLGVTDIPYTNGGVTTFEVATFLERRYGVMNTFVQVKGMEMFQKSLEQSAKNAVEDLMSGAPAALSLTADAEQDIETEFRLFIDRQEMDGLVDGVPTQASLRGVNHRKANPYSKDNGPRPSFRDTGLYEASFKTWFAD